MKLLYQSSDRHDIELTKVLLESRGIPVHVSNEDTNRNLSYMSIAVKLGLWVIFEDQYNDAIALIEDDNYEVKNPRNMEEHYSILNHAQGDLTKSTFDITMLILVTVIIIGIGTYLIINVLNS